MRVGIAQMAPAACDAEANLHLVEQAAREAAGMGAQLLVLPELAATGYVLDRTRLSALAEPSSGTGPILSRWRSLAAASGLALVGGFAESAGGRLFNSAVAISQRGEIVTCYRKLHLFQDERHVFDKAEPLLPLASLAGAQVGMSICYDLRFPEVLRLLTLRGAQLVAVPTAWTRGFDVAPPPGPGQDSWQVINVLVQANLHRLPLICSSQVGQVGKTRLLGGSVIASATGEALAGPFDEAEETVAVVDLAPGAAVPGNAAPGDQAGDRSDPRADFRTDILPLLAAEAKGQVSQVERAADGASGRGQQLLAGISAKRGYVLSLHEILAEHDPEFLELYETFLDGTYLRSGTLDRRVKELVYVGVLTALGSPASHLRAHMRAALTGGATTLELLKVLEQVLPAVGVPRFLEAIEVFREVASSSPDEGGGLAGQPDGAPAASPARSN